MSKCQLLIPIIVIISLLSCTKKDSDILVDVKEVSYLNNTTSVIEGNKVLDVLGANGLIVYDTLVMITTNNPEGQLQVYSVNELKHIGSFCKKGRANNELLEASAYTEQVLVKNNHINLVMFDVTGKIKEVDVTASLKAGYTVIGDCYDDRSIGEGEMMILDNNYKNRFEFERVSDDGHRNKRKMPCRYWLFKDDKKRELKIFNRPIVDIEENRKLMPYIGSLYKHPSRNIVVKNSTYMDYLLFLDFDSVKYFTIHQRDSRTYKDKFILEQPMPAFFNDGASSDSYIMFLYRHGDYTRKETEGKWFPEVLIFDWSGNYINGFKMDRFIRFIEYDERNNTLYAINNDEELFVYDLDQIL